MSRAVGAQDMLKQYEEFIQKAAVLVEALPYIREFEGKTVVVKYGGAAMENPRLRESTTEDIPWWFMAAAPRLTVR